MSFHINISNNIHKSYLASIVVVVVAVVVVLRYYMYARNKQ